MCVDTNRGAAPRGSAYFTRALAVVGMLLFCNRSKTQSVLGRAAVEKPLSAVLKPSLLHTVMDGFKFRFRLRFRFSLFLNIPTVAHVDFNSSSGDCDHLETLPWFCKRMV